MKGIIVAIDGPAASGKSTTARSVAERLGNTPAITRKSYIHPAVFDLMDRQGEWREGLRLPRKTSWLSREERGLIAYLEEAPPRPL